MNAIGDECVSRNLILLDEMKMKSLLAFFSPLQFLTNLKLERQERKMPYFFGNFIHTKYSYVGDILQAMSFDDS